MLLPLYSSVTPLKSSSETNLRGRTVETGQHAVKRCRARAVTVRMTARGQHNTANGTFCRAQPAPDWTIYSCLLPWENIVWHLPAYPPRHTPQAPALLSSASRLANASSPTPSPERRVGAAESDLSSFLKPGRLCWRGKVLPGCLFPLSVLTNGERLGVFSPPTSRPQLYGRRLRCFPYAHTET